MFVFTQQAQVGHPELVPSAQLGRPAVFSSPLQNGSDVGPVAAAGQLDNKNPCRPVQSQIPVLQHSDSQKALSGSASFNLTRQKQLGGHGGAPGPTETNAEVWPRDSLVLIFRFLPLSMSFANMLVQSHVVSPHVLSSHHPECRINVSH